VCLRIGLKKNLEPAVSYDWLAWRRKVKNWYCLLPVARSSLPASKSWITFQARGVGVGVLPSVPRRFISNLCVPLMCIIFWSIHIVFANIYLTLLPAAGVVKGTLDNQQLSWPGPVIALLVPRWYTRSLFVFVTSVDLYKCMFKKRGTKGSRSERKQWCT
jgi:hypothetical protein